MADTLIIVALGLGLVLVTMLPYYLYHQRRERRFAEAAARARELGLHEPVSLHPMVDPERCIGTGGCVSVCPEDVIGIRNGQAYAIAPASCIGHGLCERACPVEAITLVFGTAARGVEIPRIKTDFETNVPGLHIVGELGGMGLIRNAFEQGRQCMEAVARDVRGGTGGNGGPDGDGELDAVIVGCGPAGLAASVYARHHGLHVVTLEREDIGGTVRHYPRKKVVMTESVPVPGYGRLDFREIQKEQLMELWRDIVSRTNLEVRTGETVTAVRRENGGFVVASTGGEYRSRRVVLAIGRRGVPRRLGVPGEDSARVAYSLREPEAYEGDRILVVGGGDSALEAALALAKQPGNRVHVSYRGTHFSRAKPANRARMEEAVASGALQVLWQTRVEAITPDSVRYTDAEGAAHTLDNDRVFIFIGGELPTRFLRECGVAIDVKFGTP